MMIKSLRLRLILVGVLMVGNMFLRPVWAQDFPSPTGYVNDLADLFSSDFRQQLETELSTLEEETTVETEE